MLEAHWMYWTAGIGRFLLPETSTTNGDARPSLGRQRTIKHWLRLFGHRSKSEKALALVVDVAAVAQNYPPRCYAVAAQALSLSSSKILINYP